MSAEGRTREFIDYITRHKDVHELGYMNYKNLHDDAYRAESTGDTSDMTPQLREAYNKFWKKYSSLEDKDYPTRNETRTSRINKALDL